MLSIILSTVAASARAASSAEPASWRFSAATNGYRSSLPELQREPVVTSPTGVELVAEADLPAHFDWRNVNGQSFVTPDLQQHLPHYCGSCWIHGAVQTLNDRIKVQRQGRYPDVQLSRQALINCVPSKDSDKPPPGCDGGDVYQIHKYMHKNKVPDETCMPYLAKNMKCEPKNICANCAPNITWGPDKDGNIVPQNITKGPCYAVKHYAGYKVGDYGNVSGEVPMMKEIYARGPIACGIAVAIDNISFVNNYSQNKGILKDNVYVTDTKAGKDDSDHVVEITGWGETALGTKYWVARNSWGTYWGDRGWFKIRRGVNQNLIEDACDWAVVDVQELEDELKGQVLGDYYTGITIKSLPAGATLSVAQPGGSGQWLTTLVALAVGGAAGSAITSTLAMRRKTHRQPRLLG